MTCSNLKIMLAQLDTLKGICFVHVCVFVFTGLCSFHLHGCFLSAARAERFSVLVGLARGLCGGIPCSLGGMMKAVMDQESLLLFSFLEDSCVKLSCNASKRKQLISNPEIKLLFRQQVVVSACAGSFQTHNKELT